MDMIISDESPSDISDKIKELLFTKSAEKIDSFKPSVASSFFDIESDEDFDGEE